LRSWYAVADTRRNARRATKYEGSALGGPELILRLLVSPILPEDLGLAVLDDPDVNLRRGPGATAAPGALGAQYDDAITYRGHAEVLGFFERFMELSTGWRRIPSLWSVS
jgi:hypothetical protein